MKNLILIKLGGSVITDKTKPFTARPLVIRRLAREIKKARKKLGKDTLFLIGHGGGSFPHVPAAKYQTQKGLINKDSVKGLSLTADAAIRIDRILIKEFLKVGLPAISFAPLSFFYARKNARQEHMLSHIRKCFDIGVLPVVYGDVIMDEKEGFCIFSAEKTLAILARELTGSYKIEKFIEVGDTDGVYGKDGKTIPEITAKNFSKVKRLITGSKSTDVTGGMIHKVKESLSLVKDIKTPTVLINGNIKDNLLKVLLGRRVLATIIR